MYQFFKTIIFLLSFIVDIIVISPDGLDSETLEYFIVCIASRAICFLVMFDHAIYETRQLFTIFKSGKSFTRSLKNYFIKDFWNVFDLAIFLLYCGYLPLVYLYEPEHYSVKIVQCAIIMLYSVKFNFYLRLFDRFGFLV
jgi:hypothetical protein